MTSQLSLYDAQVLGVPHNGTETSIEAAIDTAPRAGSDAARVLDFIGRSGNATCDEVEVGLGMRHQTASARINGLLHDRRIVRTGDKRKTRTGSNAFVYKVNS